MASARVAWHATTTSPPPDHIVSRSQGGQAGRVAWLAPWLRLKLRVRVPVRSTLIEHNNINLIRNIDLTHDDLTMKLRIVCLWKLPDHINKNEVYSIEMILMDEEVKPLILIDEKPTSLAELDEPMIYRCTKCLIQMRVQDHTGVVSLTLFDREAKKQLNVSAKDLIGNSQSNDVIQMSSTSSRLKRNLSDAYDVDPPTANSTTKLPCSSVSSGQADGIKLLLPELEM
ncbi:hypothetical protein QVD17_07148 [Tagetes erecta]|uniref:Replication factor A C-terminal domain-containing protein n=1 Tax=Tagetes erecta TaxID=13708 RepID=A0AAD8PCR5_TARER|nr:hypothetical protein QVD17_07148 [Tagetes erecta]